MTETPQHMTALKKANDVREARAALKRGIASGEIPVAEVVAAPPEEAGTMTLSQLLTSQRRWGATRARKFLQGLALAENKKLESLTSRQRRILVRALEGTAPPALAAA